MKRIHRPLAEGAAAVIDGVFGRGRVLDRELAAAFRAHPKWGGRDRAFVAETVFEVTRWRRALEFVAGSSRVAALCAAQWQRMGFEAPDWWHHDGSPAEDWPAREAALAGQPRTVRESVPEWLDALGEAELGWAWAAELAALNRRAPVFLRVNTLLEMLAETLDRLAARDIDARPVDGVPDALVLAGGATLPRDLAQDGRLEIQDAASQMIAPLLDPRPGERIIDACAGAGGKTLHLAALTGNRAEILALDVVPRKLAELEKRANRAGADRVRTALADPALVASLAGSADKVLIDAPCSGLGTLRRQPDLKWRLCEDTMQSITAKQRSLLETFATLAKPGGTVVYATCSLLPCENRAVVDSLLAGGGFERAAACDISPAATGFDGFSATVLRRVGREVPQMNNRTQ